LSIGVYHLKATIQCFNGPWWREAPHPWELRDMWALRSCKGDGSVENITQCFCSCSKNCRPSGVILVLNQYICIGCSLGKHPDTATMATGSDDDSRDSVPDRCLCIAV
jgi:hypothetical protein